MADQNEITITDGKTLAYHAGGRVDAVEVTLRFMGDELDPDEITRLFGVAPTSSRRKGESYLPSKPERVARTNLWNFSRPESSNTLEEEIQALFLVLPDDLEIWQNLSSKYNGYLYCSLFLYTRQPGLEFSPRIIHEISARGLKMGLDIYCLCEADS